MPEWTQWLSGAVSLLALAGMGLLWLRSAPEALRQAIDELHDNQQRLADAVDAEHRSTERFKLDIDGTLEAVTRLAEQTDRTRKVAAARESRKKKKEDEPTEVVTDEFGLPTEPGARSVALSRLAR